MRGAVPNGGPGIKEVLQCVFQEVPWGMFEGPLRQRRVQQNGHSTDVATQLGTETIIAARLTEAHAVNEGYDGIAAVMMQHCSMA